VKKALWQFLLVTIAVVYCLVIGLYNSQALAEQLALSGNTDSESQYVSASGSSYQFGHTNQTVSYGTVSGNLPFTPLKNLYKAFLACVKIIEKLYFSFFSQYRFYSQNELIRLKQTDLIFPFHYFW